MNDVLTWGAIIAALGSIITAAKLWMDLGATRQKAADASKSATEAHARIDRVIESSATKGEFAAAERRFADAITGIRTDMQHLVGRLDSLLVAIANKGTS